MEIAADTIRFVIDKARGLTLDAADLNDEDEGDDTPAFAISPEQDEIKEFIGTLDSMEQAELIALVWIGQGTFTSEDWDEAVDAALEEHNEDAADYLLTFPLLADDLEAGLTEMGLSSDEDEEE